MIDRLNTSIDHIEAHLGDDVDITALARITATSEYHYRRMFSALAGMPLSQYIRRRRLTLAAAELAAGDAGVLEVALRNGYGSGEAFGRAFRAMHGIGPGEARRPGISLQSQPRISFRLSVEGRESVEYRIEHKEAFAIVGRRTRVSIVYEGRNPEIEQFVVSIDPDTYERIAALNDQEPSGILAVCDAFDEERTEGSTCDYYQAVATSREAPGDLDALPVEGGMWAVFRAEGALPEAAQYLWRDAYGQWFPSNPYQQRPGPELLRVRASDDGTRGEAELWLPVHPLKT